MCWMAALPVAMAGVQSIGGQYAQAKLLGAQIDASRRQAIELIRQTNIQNADLTLQARSRLEEASAELTAQNMQKVQAMGSIRATIGEGNLEGASMERIKRVAEGDFIREANMVTANYRRDYQAIFAQQVGNVMSTKSQISALNRSEPKGASKLQQVLDPVLSMGTAAVSTYASGGFSSKSNSKPTRVGR